MKLSVDIVIPTLLKSPEYLHNCLLSVAELETSGMNVQVIIVCNTFSVAVAQFQHSAQRLLEVFPFEVHWVVLEKNTGFAEATNQGIQQGTGRYVVCLNDDTQVEKEWLQELVRTATQTSADMIASRIFLSDQKTIDSEGFSFAWRGKAEAVSSERELSFQNDPDYWKNNQNHSFLLERTLLEEPFGPDAAGCLYTRKMLNDVGVFDASFFAYLEDVELALRARKKGYRCVLAPRAVVYHFKHATSSSFSSFKQKQDLLNWWRIIKKHYTREVWRKYFFLILVERMRNCSGWMKSILHQVL